MTLTTDRHSASCGLCATAELLIESAAVHLCCPGNSAVSKFVVVTCCTIVCCHCYSDPFADDEGGTSQDGYIHIRIQQRNGRKTLTTVQGISAEFDLKKIVKVAKKVSVVV